MHNKKIKKFYCSSRDYFLRMEKGHDRIFYLPIINLLKEKEITLGNKKILDVGSGTGKFLRVLREEFKNTKFKAFGTDISIQGKDFHKGIKFIQADAQKLPFKDKEYDIVFSIDVLPSVNNYKKVIKEIYRVTKSNGYIIIRSRNFLPLILLIKIKNCLSLLKNFLFLKKREKKELSINDYNELYWFSSPIYSFRLEKEFLKLKGRLIIFKTWTREGFWMVLNRIPLIRYLGTVNLILFKKK